MTQELKERELLKSDAYNFLREHKHLGKNIMLLSLGGSKAYGTDTPESDTDIRGFALNPRNQVYGLEKDYEQVVDLETDTTVFSLTKMIKLLISCNPNTIEILGCRPQDYLYTNKYGDKVLQNKQNFLSIKAIDTFGGYARAQYNRLEHSLLGNGAYDDKLFNMLKHSMDNIIEAFNIKHRNNQLNLAMRLIEEEKDKDIWGKMKHSAKAEEVGQDLVISGSLNEYPVSEFKTIISELHKAQSEFGNINKRNTKKTDKKLAKHMMHLIRLYLMGIDLNRSALIKTYRDGEEHQMLMDIRNGKYMYSDGMKVRPEFYDLLHQVQKDYQDSQTNTVLPEEPNYEALNEMLFEIYTEAYNS